MKQKTKPVTDRAYPITVAIPVLNEEGNIKETLQMVLSQREKGFNITEIMIVSDGSTDQTVKRIKEIDDRRIRIIDSPIRKGKATRLNEIFATACNEIIILLDADIILKPSTLSKLLSILDTNPSVGLISGSAIPLPGRTFIENSVNITIHAYHEMILKIKEGNNLYAVEGRILAIRRSIGRAIPLPAKSIATDAFLYFSTLKQGFSFIYMPQAVVYFRSPTTLKEQINQNKRFVARKFVLNRYFGSIVEKESQIPRFLYSTIMFRYFLVDPVHCCSIFIINAYTKYLAKFDTAHITGLWPIAESTKKAFVDKKSNTL